ncbi:hypothetical protein BDV12DRAFT_186736 [Aspergillus spectabilis]
MDAARLETALGHKQQLARNYDLLSLTSLGIVIANAWALTGGTIVTALQNGGPMAILYGLIVVSVFYTLITASLGELASSMPSAGGVYYWSSVLSGKHGRWIGYLTGYLNACGWLLSASSISSILANEVLAMYILQHPTTKWHSWQVFILFQIFNWTCCGIVCFGNRFIPTINGIALLLSMGGLLVTVIILAVMPKRHATVSDVWLNYQNNTGGWSDGICFLAGLLNAAFAVGVPDCISHLSEEVPNPTLKVPQAMLLQMLTSFTTAFIYLIALFYSISDLPAILSSNLTFFPTAAIYLQATSSPAAATALVAILFLSTLPTLLGTFVTGSRMWFSLARDSATPFPVYLAHIDEKRKTPIRATIAMATLISVIGIIYLASTTAFQALISSYIVLSTLSYLGAILPNILTARKRLIPGPFYLGKRVGMVVNCVSVVYIAVTVVFFCFPFLRPVTVGNMNWTCVVVVGVLFLAAGWWAVRIRGGGEYRGPKYDRDAAERFARGINGDEGEREGGKGETVSIQDI